MDHEEGECVPVGLGQLTDSLVHGSCAVVLICYLCDNEKALKVQTLPLDRGFRVIDHKGHPSTELPTLLMRRMAAPDSSLINRQDTGQQFNEKSELPKTHHCS